MPNSSLNILTRLDEFSELDGELKNILKIIYIVEIKVLDKSIYYYLRASRF